MPLTTDSVEALSGFQDRDKNAAVAVLSHDVRLRNAAVADGSDVVEIDRRSIHLTQRQVADARQRDRRGVDVDVVLVLTDLRRASGQDDVLRRHRVQHIDRRKPLRLQQLRVEIQHDGTLFAAVHVGNDGARNRDQLRPDEVQAEIVQLLLGEPLPGESELKNRYGGGAEVDDLRRQDARRQAPQNELRSRRDLRVRGVEARARLQIDLDDHLAGNGGRLGVLDVVDQRGQHLLIRRRQTSFELLRIESRILPRNRDRPEYRYSERCPSACA